MSRRPSLGEPTSLLTLRLRPEVHAAVLAARHDGEFLAETLRRLMLAGTIGEPAELVRLPGPGIRVALKLPRSWRADLAAGGRSVAGAAVDLILRGLAMEVR